MSLPFRAAVLDSKARLQELMEQGLPPCPARQMHERCHRRCLRNTLPLATANDALPSPVPLVKLAKDLLVIK